MQTNAVTITLSNPSPEQLSALSALLNQDAPVTKRGRGRPAKTVSFDEAENFGTKELSEEELGEIEETEETEEGVEEEETEEEAEEEETLSFDTVKEAINKFGNKKPDAMKNILTSFGVKNTKDLEKKKAKWQPVYAKVMAKLKAEKKG